MNTDSSRSESAATFADNTGAFLVRPATARDLPRVIAAADGVFRSPTPAGLGSMGRDYPLLFDPGNAAHLIIAEPAEASENRGNGTEPRGNGAPAPTRPLLAHAGFVLQEASLAGTRVRVATIGAVFTRPDQRQRGLATQVLAAAVTAARNAGAELGLVSGDRGLYERAGFGPYPSCPRYRVAAGPGDASVRIQPYTPAALPALMQLSAGERVHFVRSVSDWQRLLGAGVIFFEPAETFLVEEAGAPVAYLVVGRPGPGEARDDGRPGGHEGHDARAARVLELGGDRGAIARAAPVIAARLGCATLDLILPPEDRSLAPLAQAAGWRADEARWPFTYVWWNPARASLPLPFYGFNYV